MDASPAEIVSAYQVNTDSFPVNIKLLLPPHQEWVSIVRLLLGGLGAQLNFRVDEIEDLKLAVEQLILQASAASEVALCFTISEQGIRTKIGPLQKHLVQEALFDVFQETPLQDEALGLREILGVLVDSFGLEEETEEGFTIRLEKLIR